jgi:hypothetical protein
MKGVRYTDKFRSEAIERGHGGADVAKRLEVPTKSPYLSGQAVDLRKRPVARRH